MNMTNEELRALISKTRSDYAKDMREYWASVQPMDGKSFMELYDYLKSLPHGTGIALSCKEDADML